MNQSRNVSGVQALRGIAALLVVFHHACQYLVSRIDDSRGNLDFSFGAIGVDLFFTISGFVMVISTPKSSGLMAGITFLRKRAQRVLPMYWLATVTLGAAYFAIPSAFSTLQITFQDFLKSMLFLPVHDSRGYLRPIVSQGWTLYFEWFFYLLFAFIVLIGAKRRVATVIGLLILAYLVGIVSLGKSMEWVINSPLLFEFAAGCMAGLLWKGDAFQSFSPHWLGLISLLAIITAYFAPHLTTTEWSRLFYWGIPSTIILITLCTCEANGIRFKSRILSILGDSSYSVYLFHGFGITLIGKLIPSLNLSFVPLMVLLSTFGVATGVTAYFLIERHVVSFFKSSSI